MTFGPQLFGEDGYGAQGRSELLSLRGPHIQVIVASPALAAIGINTNFRQMDALIDTGATDICIDMQTAEKLQLPPVDTASLGGIGGRIDAKIYAGLLEVPNLQFKQIVRMFSPIGATLPSKVILGRSFLKNYIMTYHGPLGLFQFFHPTYSAAEPIDDE